MRDREATLRVTLNGKNGPVRIRGAPFKRGTRALILVRGGDSNEMLKAQTEPAGVGPVLLLALCLLHSLEHLNPFKSLCKAVL